MTEWHADDTVDQGEPLALRRGFSWTNQPHPRHQPRRNTMHAYPPEYDDPCVADIPAPELPDWLDPSIYWDEDGRVFVMRKTDGEQITLSSDVEATDDEEADYAAIKAEVLARFNVDQAVWLELSRELQAAFAAAQAHSLATMPTFDEFWADIEDYVGIECGEAGDWSPYWCDDCETWHKTAECTEFVVEDGIRYVRVRNVDQDGDWDATDYCDDEWTYCYQEHVSTAPHFHTWGEYHLWCAGNGGVDPLEEFHTQPATVAQHLDAVREQIKYLRMGVPHAVIEYANS